jgi:hypothetical protein
LSSLYRHHVYRGHAHGSLRQAIASTPHLLNSGRYAKYIPQWLKLFGSNVEFVVFDDIVTAPQDVVRDVCRFIGVDAITTPPELPDKVATVSPPRLGLMAKLGVRTANALRGHRLHALVQAGKRVGLNKLVLQGGKQELPGFTADEQRWILEQYDGDISLVESLLGRDLSNWRQIRGLGY